MPDPNEPGGRFQRLECRVAMLEREVKDLHRRLGRSQRELRAWGKLMGKRGRKEMEAILKNWGVS